MAIFGFIILCILLACLTIYVYGVLWLHSKWHGLNPMHVGIGLVATILLMAFWLLLFQHSPFIVMLK